MVIDLLDTRVYVGVMNNCTLAHNSLADNQSRFFPFDSTDLDCDWFLVRTRMISLYFYSLLLSVRISTGIAGLAWGFSA